MKVVGIGEVLWDVFPTGKQIGGAPGNFAYGVSQFGLSAVAVSALGRDDLGREASDVLSSKGLSLCCPEVDAPTGIVEVSLSEGGIPSYEIIEEVAWDNIPFTEDLALLAQETEALCFGSLAQRSPQSRETIRRFIAAMPQGEQVYRVFDINLRKQYYSLALIEESLELCNVLKINDEELEIIGKILGIESLNAEARCRHILSAYGLKMLILTCGTKGSYIYSPEGVSYQATPLVQVVDTVGAGDSFTAAFIASLLLGRTIVEAHRKAVEVSAYVCTQSGAMPLYPKALISFECAGEK